MPIKKLDAENFICRYSKGSIARFPENCAEPELIILEVERASDGSSSTSYAMIGRTPTKHHVRTTIFLIPLTGIVILRKLRYSRECLFSTPLIAGNFDHDVLPRDILYDLESVGKNPSIVKMVFLPAYDPLDDFVTDSEPSI